MFEEREPIGVNFMHIKMCRSLKFSMATSLFDCIWGKCREIATCAMSVRPHRHFRYDICVLCVKLYVNWIFFEWLSMARGCRLINGIDCLLNCNYYPKCNAQEDKHVWHSQCTIEEKGDTELHHRRLSHILCLIYYYYYAQPLWRSISISSYIMPHGAHSASPNIELYNYVEGKLNYWF